MKKFLLQLLILTALSTAAFAQNGYAPDSKVTAHNNPVKARPTVSNKKAYVNGWYSYAEMIRASNISTQLGSPDTHIGYIGNDTATKSVAEDGTYYYNFWHGFGQVFDPKDNLIELTGFADLELSRFNSYYFDSVAFPYCYNRWVDSFEWTPGVKSVVVDTFFIAYYKGAAITQTNWVADPKDKVSILPYNNSKLAPASYIRMDTILLTSGVNGLLDSTSVFNNNGGFENSVGLKTTQFAAPANTKITMASTGSTKDGLIGVAFKFAPGVPTVWKGDTAVRFYSKDPATKPANMRRTNSFAFRYLQNQVTTPRFSNPTYYNCSQLQPAWSAYGQNTNWKNVYVAGTGFTQEIFVDIDFYLSNRDGIAQNVKEVSNVNSMEIYPNPASSNAVVSFKTLNNASVSINVYNLVGQLVKSENAGSLAAGSHQVNLDLNNLKAGVYMVSVTAGNSTTTQKLIIAQ